MYKGKERTIGIFRKEKGWVPMVHFKPQRKTRIKIQK
jgi:hypothetical protein